MSLDPDNSELLHVAGILSATLGRWDDAARQQRLALAHDPLFSYGFLNLGTALYGAGRFAEAEVAYRKVIELAPEFLWVPYYLGKTLLAEGKRQAALETVQQDKDEEDRISILPIVLQAAGHQAAADEALKTLISRFGDTQPYYVAMNYAYRNEPEHALHWLELAYQQKHPDLPEILGEHLFANIAGDSRYKAFLKKMKLRT